MHETSNAGAVMERLSVADTAFFLDFDGTLSEIVEDPAEAGVSAQTLWALEKLHEAAGGAVAVVSGRSIAQLDRMLSPLRLPAAGVHGMERRGADGRLRRTPIDEDALRRLSDAVEAFARERPGLLAEPKPGSVALHYRRRPELEEACLDLAAVLAGADAAVKIVRGKMVVEMKLAARGKGDAIADFMAEPPFAGRRPFFAGDDVTDEAGFVVVNEMGGLSMKVGPGGTAAPYRIADVAAVAALLDELAAG